MKISLLPLLLALCMSYFSGCASTPEMDVNNISTDEAVQIASQLTYKMPEEDVLNFLHQNGIAETGGGGGSLAWSVDFGLLDRRRLELVFRPEHGLLEEASIRNYRANLITTIKLKNAP